MIEMGKLLKRPTWCDFCETMTMERKIICYFDFYDYAMCVSDAGVD